MKKRSECLCIVSPRGQALFQVLILIHAVHFHSHNGVMSPSVNLRPREVKSPAQGHSAGAQGAGVGLVWLPGPYSLLFTKRMKPECRDQDPSGLGCGWNLDT